jgi:hypothetical protein
MRQVSHGFDHPLNAGQQPDNANQGEVFLWMAVLWFSLGFFLLLIALTVLHTRKSFFQGAIDFLEPVITTHWAKWIDARLTPEQQKQLQQDLNRRHPLPRVRTIGAAIVITASSFLIANAIGAVIEMYVQDWWSSFLERITGGR